MKPNRIYVVGPDGIGKSTIAEVIAHELDWPMHECSERIMRIMEASMMLPMFTLNRVNKDLMRDRMLHVGNILTGHCHTFLTESEERNLVVSGVRRYCEFQDDKYDRLLIEINPSDEQWRGVDGTGIKYVYWNRSNPWHESDARKQVMAWAKGE